MDAMTPPAARIKGLILAARRNWIQGAHGRKALDAVLLQVPTSSREVLLRPIRATGWYPIAVNADLDWAICKVMGRGDHGIFRRLGAHSADLIVSSTYPGQVRSHDAAGFLAAVAHQAPRYYEGLSVVVERSGPGHSVLSFSGIVSNEPNCESNIGYYLRGIEICGGTAATGNELSCTAQGAASDRYEFRWTPDGGDAARRGVA